MPTIDIPTWPRFETDEIDVVTQVLTSGKVNAWTGNTVSAFEVAWQEKSNCDHAMAMANGTLTLEAAIRALGLDANTEVIVPARTYVATASAVALAGLKPVFADVDSMTGCVTPQTLEEARTARTGAIVVVHLGGWPADMAPIVDWSREHGIIVIEDAAQAHGATTQESNGQQRWVGTFGDFGSWSFCQDKIMSTGGEGGLLAVREAELADRVWSLRDHGKSRSRVNAHVGTNRFAWWVDSVGSNLRMTAMQAAIGSVQLQKLDSWLEARARNATVARAVLGELDWVDVDAPGPSHRPAWYRVYVRLGRGISNVEKIRNAIIDKAVAGGLPLGVGSCPEVYLENGMKSWAPADRMPQARDLGERCLCLSCHHLISMETMQRYAEQLVSVCRSIDRSVS